MAKKKVCVKRNEIGDCIKWRTVGDELVAEFKEEDKACNPKLFEEFKEKFDNRKIRINLRD